MEDALVLILLAVMVTIGMGLVIGGSAMLAINAYRSLRRPGPSVNQSGSANAEADA